MVRLLTRSLPVLALAAVGLIVAGSAQAAGDAVRGKGVFTAQCAQCHAVGKGAAPIMGPTLFGIVGRPAGSVPGFNYSKANKTSGLTWTPETLASYLPAPKTKIPGTKMNFNGLKVPAQVDDVIAYLATLK
jgi:cytochrome c